MRDETSVRSWWVSIDQDARLLTLALRAQRHSLRGGEARVVQ
ncbi:hypothetical protein GFS60_06870 (plasmid) [Rhodococcus sp. WAY2]|nr:hypothetical protein GFS60_06870 [Rhodococcus sp. WAY2]